MMQFPRGTVRSEPGGNNKLKAACASDIHARGTTGSAKEELTCNDNDIWGYTPLLARIVSASPINYLVRDINRPDSRGNNKKQCGFAATDDT